MRLEDTYNIHKKINSIIPFFKSKRLCNKNIHNYIIAPLQYEMNAPLEIKHEDGTIEIYRRDKTIYGLKCLCCGKEDIIENWR